MDLFAPPEVTSTLIHSGPGAGSLIEAAGAWQNLAVELENSVAVYASALSSLIESWNGPSSMAMLQAVQPYLIWLRETAQQAQQTATSAGTAAAAFTAVRSAVVTPAVVAANRTRLAQLLATNRFGQNTAAIAATQGEYQTMWANNSAAMTQYQATTSQATGQLSKFSSPLAVTNPTAPVNQNAAVSNSLLPSSGSTGNVLDQLGVTPFDPNAGWFGYFSTWGNQFISSGFPINMLGVWAQLATAQGVQSFSTDIGTGLSEGLGAATASLSNAIKGIGAGAGSTPAAAMGVGVSLGKLTAPPAVVGLLPATQTPVQLASSVSPLPADAGLTGMPLMPMMAPSTNSAGSGWRKRKQQKFEDLEYGAELPKKVIQRPPSGG